MFYCPDLSLTISENKINDPGIVSGCLSERAVFRDSMEPKVNFWLESWMYGSCDLNFYILPPALKLE